MATAATGLAPSTSRPRPPVGTESRGFDFAPLVGHEGWQRLAPDIRLRFSEKPHGSDPVRYIGFMQRIECSWPGWLLAQLCRMIGTPFAPWRGTDVLVAIVLRTGATPDEVIWDREYHYSNSRPNLVRSVKRIAADGELLECVGGGFGMRLTVYEAGRALHFRSLRYFWRCGRWLLPLPDLLSPGEAHVVHQDLGEGRFRFAMTIRHKLLGALFHQEGVFHREESSK